jgi:site-specific DNA recombinase
MDLYQIRNELISGKSIYDLDLRVVFYARVSTDTLEQKGSLKNQVEYYKELIEKNPHWELVDGYIDEGFSGTSVKKREAFLKMLQDAKLKKFNFVITKEISRFSRNTLDSIRYTQELLSYGVGVFFQSDNINTFFPDSELRLTIMSSIAQEEVRKISERVRFGFKRAIEKGVVLGNDNIWGYQKNNGKLIIDEEEANIVRQIFDMYATQNKGIRSICNELKEQGITNRRNNIFSFSTIKSILTNPKYMGYYCGNKTHKIDYKLNERVQLKPLEWIMYQDNQKVPPIIPVETWKRANEILRKRGKEHGSNNKTSYHNKYSYSGKINCNVHDVAYHRGVYRYPSGNREVWQCKRYVQKGKNGCDFPPIYTSELDLIMKEAYNFIIQDKEEIANELLQVYVEDFTDLKAKKDLNKSNAEIAKLIRMKDKLLDFSVNGIISDSEFKQKNNDFNHRLEAIKERVKDLEKSRMKTSESLKNQRDLKRLIEDQLFFENGFDNMLIDAMVDKIQVCGVDEQNVIYLKVTFKIIREVLNCKIDRRIKSTSVCLPSYI